MNRNGMLGYDPPVSQREYSKEVFKNSQPERNFCHFLPDERCVMLYLTKFFTPLVHYFFRPFSTTRVALLARAGTTRVALALVCYFHYKKSHNNVMWWEKSLVTKREERLE